MEPDGPVHVLPHHAVYKKDKIRVVFDAAAGHPKALNDCIRTGPNLIADLTGILLRFRFNRIGITADLEKAFLQLSLHPADRDVTRFLWKKNASDTAPTTYRMTRVVFGVNASPFLLQATIRRHLHLFESSDQETVGRLIRDIYCDDLITSVTSEEEARQLKERTVQIFSDAKMNMTKWTMSLQKLADLQEFGDGQERKVLGVSWVPSSDELVVTTSQLAQLGSCMPETKRTILKIAAKFYDPIGLLTPLLVRAKMMLKNLWRSRRGWDQDITDEVKGSWRKWLYELQELDKFTVPRSYGLTTGGPYQLHVFCDASKDAYAAVVYMRTENQGQPGSTTLLISKSRLSPSQEMTIPRLELTAALIGSRLLAYVKEQLTEPPQKSFLWTDSMVTLCWIRSDAERWGVYVKNRIREIQALTASDIWSHCPGNENPADLPSRGSTAERLSSYLWLHGPRWLSQDASCWPQGESSGPEPRECQTEEKKRTLLVISSAAEAEGYLFDPVSCSTLEHLLRVTGWVKRWTHNCQNESKRRGPLSAEEIQEAMNHWIRSAQSAFRDEITALQKGQPLPLRSRLRSLMPEMEGGILRKGGRLQETLLTEEEKHPIILPPDHHLVQLLAEDTHRRLCHAGTQQVLAALRDKFWILRGRQVVRSSLRRCPNCAIFRAQPLSQLPAPLPSSRTNPSRPFSHTGVDLGGPLIVRGAGRQQKDKLYFAVFTCAVTRALHLELVSSQTTEDFMKAYRRFSARRGKPLVMMSDNARNFKGAARMLAVEGVTWHFIVERAPWWGGFWERMIGLTKFAFRRTLGRALLGKEELETVLCNIESAINARPLTAVSDDPEDPRPLRPVDFLQCPVGDESAGSEEDLRGRLWYHKTVASHLWRRWQREYLRNLRDFQQASPVTEANVGDLVLIEGDQRNRLTWKTGVIQQLHPGRDGRVRAVTLRTADGDRRRPVQRLYLLEGARAK